MPAFPKKPVPSTLAALQSYKPFHCIQRCGGSVPCSSCLFPRLCAFVHRHLRLALRVGFSLSGGSFPPLNLPYILTTPTSVPSLNYKVVSPYPSPHSLKPSSSDWQACCNCFCLQCLYATRCSCLLLLSWSLYSSITKISYECWTLC